VQGGPVGLELTGPDTGRWTSSAVRTALVSVMVLLRLGATLRRLDQYGGRRCGWLRGTTEGVRVGGRAGRGCGIIGVLLMRGIRRSFTGTGVDFRGRTPSPFRRARPQSVPHCRSGRLSQPSESQKDYRAAAVGLLIMDLVFWPSWDMGRVAVLRLSYYYGPGVGLALLKRRVSAAAGIALGAV